MRNTEEKRTLREDFALFWRACGLLCQICPRHFFWQIASGVVNAVVPFFGAYMSSALVNELAGECSPKRLLFLAALTVGGGFLISLISRLVKSRVNVWSAGNHIREDLYFLDVQNRMQYAHLEDPDVTLLRQNIYAAKNANGGGLLQVQWAIPHIIGNAVTVLTSLSLSVSILDSASEGQTHGFLHFADSPFAIFSLAAMVILESIVLTKIYNAKSAKTAKEWEALSGSNTRLGILRHFRSADTYIFNMKKIILPEMAKTSIRPQYILNSNKIVVKSTVLAEILKAAVELWLFVIVAAKAFLGAFGIGNYILYRTTLGKLIDAICELGTIFGRTRYNNKYLIRLYKYLDLPDEMYHGTLAVEKRDDIDYEIEFRNVSFKYPKSETYALKNVSMKLRIGDKLSIVGENGSGKTTFIKLLCRLYDPTEGTILLNGIDISRYRYEEYLSLFSIVFQDYRLFSFSIADNVACSHSRDAEKVRSALARAGLAEKIEGLEKGIDTFLRRDYENDGIELSGGEAQKLALARALYKDAPFVVLDEPTAALDPIGEAEVYAHFNQLVQNKTSVFISHRLSSCRFCDDIVVFDHGSIVARGSHDALVADENGKYFALWNAQAQYYTE